jgi:hypothetical protein
MSTNIFDTTLLNNEPARYVVIAEACLPGLIFLIIGFLMFSKKFTKFEKYDSETIWDHVNGGPTRTMDCISWLVMVALWTIGLVVAALNFSSTALAVVAATSLLTILMGAIWMLWFDPEKKNDSYAPSIALYIAFIGMITSAIAAAANSADENARLATAAMLAPVAGFFGYLMMINYLQFNLGRRTDLGDAK